MKFRVLFEQTVRRERTVEADTYEDAIKIARREAPRMIADKMQATWVGSEQHLQENEEFEFQILGDCDYCGKPLIDRTPPGQPYAYGLNPNNDHEMWCYACLKLDELRQRGKEVRL